MTGRGPRRPLAATGVVFLLLLGLAIALQYSSGAYTSAFGGFFDEPAHYVTGLMVRDYVASGTPAPPVAYASRYYLQYPEVALGMWPPGFYVLQAAWALLFSPERVSVLLLMATLSSVLALAVFHVARQEFDLASAVVGSVLVVALPLNQTASGQIMADLPVALFGFLAILALGRYVDHERWTDAAAFGVLASFAIMTKGNGFALALAPPLTVLLARRLDLMRRLSFWLPVGIVLVLCGPWYALTAGTPLKTALHPEGAGYTARAAVAFSSYFVNVFGLLLFPVICLGAVTRLRRLGGDGRVSGRWAAIVALPVTIWVFHIAISAAYEDRYVVAATPVLALLLLAGIWSLAALLPFTGLDPMNRHRLLTGLCVMVFMVTVFHIPQKRVSGYIEAAESIRAAPGLQRSILMVSTAGVPWNGEGMLIAEIAMREERPGRCILRATKALSRIDWHATQESPRYQTPEEVMAFLDRVPVGGLVLDMSPKMDGFDHHDLLVRTVQAHAERFALVSTHPVARGPAGGLHAPSGELLVYRVLGNEDPSGVASPWTSNGC